MEEKKKIISLVLISGLLIGTIAMSGCTQQKTNTIIVGTSSDFKPFEYKAANGTIIGFDIDLITRILTNQGYNVTVQDIGFDSLIPSLQTGKIDVIAAGMSINEERKGQVDFSNPYYEANQSVLVKIGSGVVINQVDDLANYTLGAQTGTTGWQWINDTFVTTGKITPDKLKSYVLYPEAVADLIAGRIGAVVIDSPVAKAFAQSGNVKIVLNITTNESYGFAVKIGNTALANKINTGLASVMASSYWDELIQKYFTT
jgi:polar amino acid transport system substrate-binding protein